MRSDQVSPIPLNLDDGNQNVASALRAEDELAVSGVVSGRGILALVFPAVTDRQMFIGKSVLEPPRIILLFSRPMVGGAFFCFVSSWNPSVQNC